MIVFGVPLRSRGASRDWGVVSRCFERTLNSICSQTSGDFRVVVACHDVPDVRIPGESRVEVIQVGSPVPQDYGEQMLDKGWKVHAIAKRCRELGGGYLMLVDSDDLVSNRIAEYCSAHPSCNGFTSDYGWFYSEGAASVRKMRSMYRTCGSCTIVNWSVDDLPRRMPSDWHDQDAGGFVVRSSHRVIPDRLKAAGRPLDRLPFPSTVYVTNTGDNHSVLSGNTLSWKRRLEVFLQRPQRIDAVRDEFGLYRI